MSANIGKVIGVNGNLLKVEFENPVILNEVAYAQLSGTEIKLKSEVIRVRGNQAELQVFEDTTGLKLEIQLNLLAIFYLLNWDLDY